MILPKKKDWSKLLFGEFKKKIFWHFFVVRPRTFIEYPFCSDPIMWTRVMDSCTSENNYFYFVDSSLISRSKFYRN